MTARFLRGLVAAAGAIALVLPTPALAKGPLKVELLITGGDLEHEIRIPADVMFRAQRDLGLQVFGYIGTPAPDSPPRLMYRLDYSVDPTEREPFVSYLYHPGRGERRAILRDPGCVGTDLGCWGEITTEFDAFLRAYLEGRPPSLPAVSGPPVAGPVVALLTLIGVVLMMSRPPIRRRLERLAY